MNLGGPRVAFNLLIALVLGSAALPGALPNAVAASPAQSAVVSIPRPQGLYFGVRVDDPQQEEIVLWRFKGTSWNHVAGDTIDYFATSQAQLTDTSLGEFEWTGAELVLREPKKNCDLSDCGADEVIVSTLEPRFTLSVPGSRGELVYELTPEWLDDFAMQIAAAERAGIRQFKPAGAVVDTLDTTLTIERARALLSGARTNLEVQWAARGRLPGWRADRMDAPLGQDDRGRFFRVAAAPAGSAAGCFLLEGKRVTRRVCPAEPFKKNQRIEGIYRQRSPAVIPPRYEARVVTFWRNGAASDQKNRVRFEDEPIYERITEAGPYRLLDHAVGLRDLISGTRMFYFGGFAIGPWVDADTPSTLYINGRVFDYVGDPEPRVGPVRERLAFVRPAAGEPVRSYSSWVRLNPDASDPAPEADIDIRRLLGVDLDSFYENVEQHCATDASLPVCSKRSCWHDRGRDHGAKLMPVTAAELAALRRPDLKFGLRIAELAPFGQFWDSSLESGDVIVAINGVRIESRARFDRMFRLLEHASCADGMRIEFLRPALSPQAVTSRPQPTPVRKP